MATSILFQREDEGGCTRDALGAFWVSRCLGELASVSRDFFGKFTKKQDLREYFGTTHIYLTKRFTILLMGLFSMEYFGE